MKKNMRSIREKTYETLKEKVLIGAFKPGERLTEEGLATIIGVSRTPIREALHKLELEGLVQPQKTRGFRVSQDSKEEIEKIFELRMIMEGYALRCICQTVKEETLDRLDIIIQDAEAAYEEKDLNAVFIHNTKFHDTLLELIADKRRLIGLIADMRQYILRYRKSTLIDLQFIRRSIDGHHKIMLALRLGDPNLCEQIMREHVLEARDEALRCLFGKK